PADVFGSGTRTVEGAQGPYAIRLSRPDPINMAEVGMDSKRVIGVDIGKWWLDVAYEESNRVKRCRNDASGIASLVDTLDPTHGIVVFERCGGYERNLEAALADAGIPWAVVHSARVKAFRQLERIKAKTDAIDARVLRDFGRDRLNAGDLRLGRPQNVT